jgi:hypothetical protein
MEVNSQYLTTGGKNVSIKQEDWVVPKAGLDVLERRNPGTLTLDCSARKAVATPTVLLPVALFQSTILHFKTIQCNG